MHFRPGPNLYNMFGAFFRPSVTPTIPLVLRRSCKARASKDAPGGRELVATGASFEARCLRQRAPREKLQICPSQGMQGNPPVSSMVGRPPLRVRGNFFASILRESKVDLHSRPSRKTKARPGEARLAIRRRARREILIWICLAGLGLGIRRNLDVLNKTAAICVF